MGFYCFYIVIVAYLKKNYAKLHMKVAKQNFANHCTVCVIVSGKLKKLKPKGPDLKPPYFCKIYSTSVHYFKSKIKTVTKRENDLFLEDKSTCKVQNSLDHKPASVLVLHV
jgi:hypothetical protein